MRQWGNHSHIASLPHCLISSVTTRPDSPPATRTSRRPSRSASCRSAARGRGSPCSCGACASCTRSAPARTETPARRPRRTSRGRSATLTAAERISTPRSFSGALHASKIGSTAGVALHPDAANRAGAVVEVEVDRRLRQLGQRRLRRAEMRRARRLARSEQPFLLAAPQADANGPPRLEARRFEDAQHFHHRGRSGGVVGGTGCALPRIEVRADERRSRPPCRSPESRRRC